MQQGEASSQSWKRHTVTLTVAASVVVVFLVALVLLNFFFAQRVHNALLIQLQRETEKQALILEHFFSERRDDLVEISRSRSLNVYFENKALGMSMEYGLRQSLPPIRENFQYYLERKHISSEPIFSRFVLLEQSGDALVDTRAADYGSSRSGELSRYLNFDLKEGGVLVHNNGAGLIVSASNYLKDTYVGQTLAWVNLYCLYKHLLRTHGAGPQGGRWALLQGDDPTRIIGSEFTGEIALPPPETFSSRGIIQYRGQGGQDALAVWAPVNNTGLILLRLVGESEMPATISPWQLLAGMTLLGALILLGAIYSGRVFLKSRILSVKLEEANARESLTSEKNALLAMEVLERSRAEESFNILKYSMQGTDLRAILEKALRDLASMPWLGLRDGSSIRVREADTPSLATIVSLQGENLITQTCQPFRRTCEANLSSSDSESLLIRSSDGKHPVWCSTAIPHSHFCSYLGHGQQEFGCLDLLVNFEYQPSEHAHRFISSFADLLSTIIQRKRSEDALQAADRTNRTLIEAIPLALILLDSQYKVVALNPTAQTWLQAEPARLIGRNILEAALAWKFEDLGDLLDKFRGLSRLEVPRDIRFSRTDGQEGFLKIILCGIPVSGVEPGSRILLLASDVTEQRHIESHLLLTQKLDAVGQLAGGIAHEINTPMQYIDGNLRFLRESYSRLLEHTNTLERELERVLPSEDLQILRKASPDADFSREIVSSLEDIQRGVVQVSNLVAAMKEFSRVDSGGMVKIDLNKALRDTVTVTHNEWKYSCEVQMNLEPDLPAIMGLPGEINQAFLNIIINAIQAISDDKSRSGGKGLITISTRENGPMVEVIIQDNGPGIPQAIIGRIFDPFFTTKPVGYGVGQGLSLARNIVVQKHHGQLFCESAEGAGASFIIRLPALDQRGW